MINPGAWDGVWNNSLVNETNMVRFFQYLRSCLKVGLLGSYKKCHQITPLLHSCMVFSKLGVPENVVYSWFTSASNEGQVTNEYRSQINILCWAWGWLIGTWFLLFLSYLVFQKPLIKDLWWWLIHFFTTVFNATCFAVTCVSPRSEKFNNLHCKAKA